MKDSELLCRPSTAREAEGVAHRIRSQGGGGVVTKYDTKKWRDTARSIMRRDGYQCQLSRRYGRQVQAEIVHHVFPADEFPELFFCRWNLVALSRAAHNRVHDRATNELTDIGAELLRRVARKNGIEVPEKYREREQKPEEGWRIAKSRRG